ncbi:MAG: hypothetical protein R2857_02030 [Vampirovibrionales bacterium]
MATRSTARALTSELLDTLEYQNPLKLYGDVALFLPELHKRGLEVTDGKDKVIKPVTIRNSWRWSSSVAKALPSSALKAWVK